MNEQRRVLFLCTGNSARSIFAEYLLKRIGQNRFETYSAGSYPTGKVNPYAVRVLTELYHIDANEARSKSWEEFKDKIFDFVITVCDNARESCLFGLVNRLSLIGEFPILRWPPVQTRKSSDNFDTPHCSFKGESSCSALFHSTNSTV